MYQVHLVIKNNKEPTQQPKQSEQSPSATPTTSTQAPPPLAQGGLPGLAGLSSLSTQNPQVLEQAQQHLLQNPELMSQLMNSPAVQGLMSNPDIFREFFLNNSQVNYHCYIQLCIFKIYSKMYHKNMYLKN